MGQLEEHDRIQEEYRVAMLQSTNPAMTPSEYRGLYGEVVTEDVYGLRNLDFAPEVICDVGACIGVFSRFARELFPEAQIVALEPDARNFYNLLLLTPESWRIEARNCALGNGPVWQCLSGGNGATQCYLSVAPGCPCASLETNPRFRLADVPTVTLKDLLVPWAGKRVLLKLDCEGGENALYEESASLEALQSVKYVAMELHNPSINNHGAEMQRGIDSIIAALCRTHTVVHRPPILQARKHRGT